MVKLTKVDLSMFSLKAHDQGSQNSCVWNAIASTLEIMSRIAGNPVADLSRQQGYNDTRIAMNKFTTDGGSNIDVAWTVAKTIGIATEASFKYSIDNLYVKPGEAVHELAATQKVGGWPTRLRNNRGGLVYSKLQRSEFVDRVGN